MACVPLSDAAIDAQLHLQLTLCSESDFNIVPSTSYGIAAASLHCNESEFDPRPLASFGAAVPLLRHGISQSCNGDPLQTLEHLLSTPNDIGCVL